MIRLILIFMSSVLLMADIGSITVVKGDAFVIRDIQEIPAHHPMPLFKQDIIETKDGRLQMQFIDNTVISLGRESRFHIREYFYEANSDQLVASFEIEKGFVKTITGMIGKLMPELFVLSTQTTDIRPHGTIWSIDVNEYREEYKVLDGSITLTFNDGEERIVELHAGESMLLELDIKDTKKIAKSLKTDIKTTEYEKYVERENATIIEEQKINHIIERVEIPEAEEPETPEIEVPEIEVPEVEVPEVEVPEIPEVEEPEVEEPEAPEVEVPEVEEPEAPEVEVPEVEEPEAPEVEIPEVEIPEVEIPEVEIPEVEIPEVEIPEVEIPEVEEPEAPEVEIPVDDGNNGHGNNLDGFDLSNPGHGHKPHKEK